MGRLHIAFTAAACAALCLPTLADAKVRTGPAGTAFYSAPASSGAHGSVVWARRQTGADALKGASSNQLVLYRSTGSQGRTVNASGSVSIPKGKVPKGGWPVLTWAHGTTGIADQCAPSRLPAASSYSRPVLQRFLKAGYAVVRTDYEGLGTPGTHPYLDGVSEGRSVLDIVRAARTLQPGKLSKTVISAGHSQGGQAALFAGAELKKYTPELKLRATVAFAPVSQLSEQTGLIQALTSPGGGLTGLVAMILRGVDTYAPSAGVAAELTPQAAALYPQTLTACLSDLAAPSSFGGLAPSDLLRKDADLTSLNAALDQHADPKVLTVPGAVRIEQGAADTTVFPMFTDELAKQLTGRNAKVTYKKFAGVTHGTIVQKAATDALSYIRKQS